MRYRQGSVVRGDVPAERRRRLTSKRFCGPTVYPTNMLGFLPDDPVILVVVLVLLSIIFFLYLMVRRTILEFRDGMRRE